MQYVGSQGGQRFQAYGRVNSAAPVLSGQLKTSAGGKQLAAAIDRSVTGHRSGAGSLGHEEVAQVGSAQYDRVLLIVRWR